MAWKPFRAPASTVGRQGVARLIIAKSGNTRLNPTAINLVPADAWVNGKTRYSIMVDSESGLVGLTFGPRELYHLNKSSGSVGSSCAPVGAAAKTLGAKAGESYEVMPYEPAGIDLVIRVREGKG